MAKNKGKTAPRQTENDGNQQESKADLQALAQAVTDATAALDNAKASGDAAAIEAAEKVLADAQAEFAEASAPPDPADEAAASEQAPAEEVTAATTEPEAPSTAAPDPMLEQPQPEEAVEPAASVKEVEAEVESLVDRLQQQIAAAEKAGNAQLHAWLLSLEGHLGSLKRHFETTHPQATAEIKALAEGIKSLF